MIRKVGTEREKKVKTSADIKSLEKQRRKQKSFQAMLVTKRILTKHKLFPCSSQGLREKRLTTETAFNMAMLLIDVFNQQLVKKENMPKEILETI